MPVMGHGLEDMLASACLTTPISASHRDGTLKKTQASPLLKMKKLRSERSYVLSKIIQSFVHPFVQQGFFEQLISEGE